MEKVYMLDVDKHRNERYGFPQTKKEEKHMFLYEIYSSTLLAVGRFCKRRKDVI